MRDFRYSKLSDWTWDSEVLDLVAGIYRHAGRLDAQIPSLLTRLSSLKDGALLESARASNAIEGIYAKKSRLVPLLEGGAEPRNKDEGEILGYKDALALALEGHEAIPITQSTILQLHKVLYARTGEAMGGRTKDVQNYIVAAYPDGTREVLFKPLSPLETPEALDKICFECTVALQKRFADPLVLIPVFIHDFLCIHPFVDGNGRMSRILTALLLCKAGFPVAKYVSLESKIEKTRGFYYNALARSGRGWHEGKERPLPFIKYLLGTILAAYKDLDERVSFMDGRLSALETVRMAVRTRIGRFSKADVLELCPWLSLSSVENSLRRLVDMGELRREGIGKATSYVRLD